MTEYRSPGPSSRLTKAIALFVAQKRRSGGLERFTLSVVRAFLTALIHVMVQNCLAIWTLDDVGMS